MKKYQEFLYAFAFPGCIIIVEKDHTQMSDIEKMYQKYGRMKRRVWLRKTKKPSSHYLETGLLGSYETAGIVDSELGGTQVALFADTQFKEEKGEFCLERQMVVGGKRFAVSSVFPKTAALTPTDKLLSLIDKEQETEINSIKTKFQEDNHHEKFNR